MGSKKDRNLLFLEQSIPKGSPISINEVDAQDNDLCEYWKHQNQIIDSD